MLVEFRTNHISISRDEYGAEGCARDITHKYQLIRDAKKIK